MVAQTARAHTVDSLLILGAQLAERAALGEGNERGSMLLYNPNHDPHSGEFASGGGAGGGGGGGATAAKGGSKTTKAARAPRSSAKGAGKGEGEGKSADGTTSSAKGSAKGAAGGAKGAGEGKPAEEDMHAKSARLQKEQGLRPEAQPGEKLQLQHAPNPQFQLDATRELDARFIVAHYGEHQLGLALHMQTPANLKEAVKNAGVTAGRSKAETISRIVSHVTQGRYSANFSKGKPSAAEAHATKAAKLRAALDKAQAAYDAHMAKAPKLDERDAWQVEGRRLLVEVRRCQAALRLAEATAPVPTAQRFPEALQRVRRFDETGEDGFHRSWIMLFPVGHYQHEQYGELDFTPAKLRKIKQQYDQRVRHIDAALDVDHRAARDDSRATGWIESLELRDTQPDGTPSGLWGCIKWTPYGMQFLRSDEYRYFSPEFGPWEDPQSGERFEDVLIGGALTNRPFLKTMPAIALADAGADGQAISRKPWGAIDKDCLPASCFLIVGDPAKKSTWRLPVYEGAGAKDADGVYTRRGPLNLNGVRAAWAAINGAHTGQPMAGVSQGVVARLKRWRARYFPDAAQTAAETAAQTAGDVNRGNVRRRAEGITPAAQGQRMEGTVGRMFDADLDGLEDDQFEDDDDDAALALADGGKPAKGGKGRKGSAAMKARMAALRAKSGLKLGKDGGKDGAAKDGADDADGEPDGDEDEDAEELDEGEGDDEDAAEMADDAEEMDDSEVYDEADGDGGADETLDDSNEHEDDADDDVDPEDDGGPEDEDESDEMPPASARRSGSGGGGGKARGSKRMMGARTAIRGGAHVRASERRQGGRASMRDGMSEQDGKQDGKQDGEMRAGETISLAEHQKLREEVAQLRFRLYEDGIEKTLSGWRRGAFQFKENAKGAPKSGRIALSKGFSDAFRAFMRSEGVRLSEASRAKLLSLVEVALSSAVVDLSERGSSYDGEGRMVAASRRAAGDDDRLEQAAQRIALSEYGAAITALNDPAKVLAIYERASKEVRY